ncbi:MAG: phosphoribosylglycinamide formyltransferase [Pseudomonadales bacterium]
MSRQRIVVLISGGGSNLQALLDASTNQHAADIELDADIVAVISNRPAAYGLKRAENVGIDAISLDHTQFDDRHSFDKALLEAVSEYSADLVILAGFMRILTPVFLTPLRGKMLNIHPSLLPKYAGLNTHQRAIDAGDYEHGATVHFVTEELDGGPAVLQAAVPVMENDSADSLAARVLEKEHLIFPLAAQWFVSNRLLLSDRGAELDGELLGVNGIRFDGLQEA